MRIGINRDAAAHDANAAYDEGYWIMSGYILFPVAAVLITAAIALNFKIGFMVAKATEDTGFDFGFYLITVVGLFAIELSAAHAFLS